jgi:DHA1 family inner membrane transport protein
MGQRYGWRLTFVVVAALAVLCAILIALYAPRDRAVAGASPRRELGALRQAQVWLTLATGAIGFGGMFAVYTYLGSTLIEVTHVSATMTVGNLVVPRFADRALMRTAGLLLLGSACVLSLYPLAAARTSTVAVDVFLIGVGGALATVLQTRLMDVAGEGQSLAAALNHSAFNVANALGPWLGGLAIAAGFGLTSTGYVGSALALGGLIVWGISRARPVPTH